LIDDTIEKAGIKEVGGAQNSFSELMSPEDATGKINWPANDGFVSGSQKIETLGVGTKLDRYGQPTGKFLAPKSDSFPSRSLAPHSENAPYYTYEIIEELEVTSGKIAPWFGQPGGGHNL